MARSDGSTWTIDDIRDQFERYSGVEPVGDAVVRQPLDGAQVIDPGDDRTADGVGDEAVFGAALGAAGRDGVGWGIFSGW